MKLIFVRHADPDYSCDSLTPVGFMEAEALRERMEKLYKECGESIHSFVSPLGRAKKTAEIAMRNTGKTAEVKEWLREFNYPVKKPHANVDYGYCVWDWYPGELCTRPAFFDREKWYTEPEMTEAGVPLAYRDVCESLDSLLKEYGYEREGLYYRVSAANHDTLVFYCHFGLECALLAHLINVSPMVLWHGFCSAPSGVTVVNTEEREEGIAYMRTAAFGDISHLYAKGMQPSFHARFCECFEDETRH